MIIEIGLCLYVLLIQQVFIIHASDICYYHNSTTVVTIICNEVCCSIMANTPDTACCSSVLWTVLAVPVFVISGICCLVVCLICCRPFLKICLAGCKCPHGNGSRVSSPNPTSANNNPVYMINTDDLPDYETIVKDRQMKDITPPTYNFVAAHPIDFGINVTVPSAPPQYTSRCNSAAIVVPISSLET